MSITTVYLKHKKVSTHSAMDKNKINKFLGLLLLVLLAGFLVLLSLQLFSLAYTPAKTVCTKAVCLKKFLDGPPAYNDEYMARFLRTKYISPPSGGSMKLSDYENSDEPSYVKAKNYLEEYFKDRRDGRFLVLGAGDGQYEDMTLGLEQNNGWSGLMVEANLELHKSLLAKQRNAEISNACVSPFSYPTLATFVYPFFEGVMSEKERLMRYRESKLKQLSTSEYKTTMFQTQCIPLANMIYASQTLTDKIDLMVMDMSGTDLDILLSTNLEWLPEIEMVMVVAHGTDIATEVGGYFMEKNMVVSKVFGGDVNNARFFITKFKADSSLID